MRIVYSRFPWPVAAASSSREDLHMRQGSLACLGQCSSTKAAAMNLNRVSEGEGRVCGRYWVRNGLGAVRHCIQGAWVRPMDE